MDLEKLKQNLDLKFNFTADFIRELLDSINLPINSKILDIGTGMGIMSIHLASKGYNIITGEPEGDKWGNWEKNLSKVNLKDKVKFIPFNAIKTPFNDSEFTGIFLYNSFHHMDKKESVIKECVRISKRDGYIILIEFNDKGIDFLRKNFRPNHIDAINPLDFVKKFPLEHEIRKGVYLNAYILINKK